MDGLLVLLHEVEQRVSVAKAEIFVLVSSETDVYIRLIFRLSIIVFLTEIPSSS